MDQYQIQQLYVVTKKSILYSMSLAHNLADSSYMEYSIILKENEKKIVASSFEYTTNIIKLRFS
jgi:hypothetical protein